MRSESSTNPVSAGPRGSRWAWRGAVACAAVGLWVSAELLAAHGGGWTSSEAQQGILFQLCGLSSTPSARCTELLDGRWGAVDFTVGDRRLVVPVALPGVVYFAAVVFWFAFVLHPDVTDRMSWLLTALLLGGGAAASVLLVAVMAIGAGFCPLCGVAHGMNALVTVAALYIWRSGAGKQGRRDEYAASVMLQRRLVGAAAAVCIVACVGVWRYYEAVNSARRYWRKADGVQRLVQEMQRDAGFMLREFYAQPRTLASSLTTGGADTRSGAAADSGGADVVIFMNYDCSACACFESEWRRTLRRQLPASVRIAHKHLPRGGQLAADDVPAAHAAAEAARSLGGAAGFERMHALLLATRDRRRDYRSLAHKAGLDAERFMQKMRSAASLRRVRRDHAFARANGIDAAPAVFVRGRQVPYLCLQSETFWRAIGRELTMRSDVSPEGSVAMRGVHSDGAR